MVSMVAGMAGRFGVNEKEAERFFKFAVVGLIGFIVDFGIFNLSLRPFELLLDN
jgi:putative flippase GtrA